METCTGTTVRPQYLRADTYSYDAVGNRTDRSAVLDGNRVTSVGGYTLEHDADGNVTRRYGNGQDVVMGWNSLGQMTSMTVNGTLVQYAYDGLGRWAYRYMPSAGFNEYLYSGDHLLLERDGNGSVVEYTYYPGVDNPHSMRRDGQTYYYTNDHPGNVAELRRSDGVLMNQYRYSPRGEREAGTSEMVGNPLQYAARHYEPAAGIYQVRARWYDPALGRFLSEDPIGLAGGINPYAYANNAPNNLRDPSGLYVAEGCYILLIRRNWLVAFLWCRVGWRFAFLL